MGFLKKRDISVKAIIVGSALVGYLIIYLVVNAAAVWQSFGELISTGVGWISVGMGLAGTFWGGLKSLLTSYLFWIFIAVLLLWDIRSESHEIRMLRLELMEIKTLMAGINRKLGPDSALYPPLEQIHYILGDSHQHITTSLEKINGELCRLASTVETLERRVKR